ncbi:MAG: 50S ribosomal protein L29 [Candidatus Sungbacteria bacterium RIFCSPLOWO2_02_FULL_48_13b]|uniref:Large ribosomal subunit protein uL29 n=2 Tax=Candidatus Sungiibacteriota TaxID=1817917 RepID=A0A1G2LGB2_9BACT|nr:MAG: 50S ribosomal protein L29 [Candidatus Sungbacteria bacterium RIFCSPHIGHO2_02_FULL_49_20]OHA09841.1 MAG: 50S ribosomal protein L29 [Candidatus Sungbacteria bacterium RIFCSPLOWO2_02_FULL_48_13b]
MKAMELRQKSAEELESILLDHRKQMEELRFVGARTKVKNVKALSQIRHEVARIKTVLHEMRSK